MEPQVFAIVLNWNGWQDTIACLASLRKQTYSSLTVLVVDNDSSDASVLEITKAFPEIEIIQSGANRGFGGGCNVGMRRALIEQADYVWLINSDATADPSALSALVGVARSCSDVGAVGSVLYEAGTIDRIQLWGGGRVGLWTGQCRNSLNPAPLDFISGASALLRVAALEKIGLFDETSYFMYWEDTDLCFRLRIAGWKLAVAEDSHIWHKQSASVGQQSPLLDRYFTQSGVRFLKRYARIPFVSISLMLGRMFLKRILIGNRSRIKAVVDGFFAA
jgi:GT2 family glycosyltransferase